MLDLNDFANRLKALRQRANLLQREIAERCKVSPQAVSKWERALSCPDILILDELALALGVEIKDLFLTEDVLETQHTAES